MDFSFASSEDIINHRFVPLVYAVNSIGSHDDFSLFDMFLNAITSTALDNVISNIPAPMLSSSNEKRTTARSISLFRPDEDDDDDDSSIDDCFVEGGFKSSSKQASNIKGALSFAPLIANKKSVAGHSNTSTNLESTQLDLVAYTKALDVNNSSGYTNFFHYAKIVSVSSRYGFPPSKDPRGNDNIAYSLPIALQKVQKYKQRITTTSLLSNEEKEDLISTIINQYKSSFLGILQSGWFDKHVHALPSIILVVCTVTSDRTEQSKQDALLYETIEHLQYSLVPKRKCPIQIVALVKDDVTSQQADGWNNSVMNEIHINITSQAFDESQSQNHADRTNASSSTSSTDYLPKVTSILLRPSIDLIVNKDLTNNESTSVALKKLHNATRDLSLYYYVQQARRTREKLAKLLASIAINQKTFTSSTGSVLSVSTNGTGYGSAPNTVNGATPGNLNRRRQQLPPIVTSSSELQPPIAFSPILIRYCIKIALFYEFQMMKHQKCILFLTEAYRYTTKYYLYLLQLDSNISDGILSDDDNMSVESTDKTYNTIHSNRSPSQHGTSSTSDVTDGSESIEIEIGTLTETSSPTKSRSILRKNNNTSKQKRFTWVHLVPKPAEDMIYQCRAIADWLNFKLIALGLASKNENGLMAIYHQFRQHTRIFGNKAFAMKYRTPAMYIKQTSSTPFAVTSCIDDWYEWLLIKRQRVTLIQLLERYSVHIPLLSQPSKTSTTASVSSQNSKYDSYNFNMDELLTTFSPWRACLSAAEAILQLGREIENMKRQKVSISTQQYAMNELTVEDSVLGPLQSLIEYTSTMKLSKASATHQRYIGSKTTETIAYEFQEESEALQKEKALDFVVKAIHLFEQEQERDNRGFFAEDEFNELSSSRTGARMFYLAGGILVGLDRHQEATKYLIKAAKYCKGWRDLELAIRRMLIDCYERQLPSSNTKNDSTDGNSEALASMILDSYFHAEMSSKDLRRALTHFASVSGGETLKWYHSTTGEENTSELPFSFSVSFPGKTHATAGDTVQASVMVKSNLDYAVHVNSVQLQTLAGGLPIAVTDLLSAMNAGEAGEGGIIIQAQTSIIISTNVKLPKDLSKIASDDSGNGGEQQGTAGKGSFAKSARPRSAGITAAGGARLVSEDKLAPSNRNSQGWNMRYLGGKPLICDGIHIVFYPVQAGASSSGSEPVTFIELTIEKKTSRTAANIKRTPFEEENYMASAWSRPWDLPLSRGPRSIRVLSPQPQLVVTNITEEITKGKALEGTINRILFKLQAGSQERCFDIKLSVSCFSVLVTPNGATLRLVSAKALEVETENSYDMKIPCFRTPSIVCLSGSGETHRSECGYPVPKGWRVAGSGQGYNYSFPDPLKEGESCFVPLDVFRPATVNTSQAQFLASDDSVSIEELADFCLCKTDFYMTITYKQERPSTLKQKVGRRTARRRPQKVTAEGGQDQKDYNEVCESGLDEVSLERTGTLFWSSPLTATFRQDPRSGNISGNDHLSSRTDACTVNEEIALYDGESVTAHCALQLDPSMEGLETEIVSVRFENEMAASPSASFTLLSSEPESSDQSVIHQFEENDPCRLLAAGSSVGVSYTVRARLNNSEESSVSLALGSLLVDWLPSSLSLPKGHEVYNCNLLGNINGHGPLALDSPATIQFRGPTCHISKVPFKVERVDLASELSIGIPFELSYRIFNNTQLSQTLHVLMGGGPSSNENNLIITGLVTGDISIGPSEHQIISYTIVATRPGEATLPTLKVASERFKTWIFDSDRISNRIFVLP